MLNLSPKIFISSKIELINDKETVFALQTFVLMLLKQVSAGKPFHAFLTLKRFLFLVSESMLPEVAFVAELLAAELTGEDVAALIVGRGEVTFETRSPPKSPVAKFAFEFLLIAMDGHVNLQS